MKRVLAFDFGASSGRAILGIFDNKKIEIQEVHRFSNDPVQIGDTLYWDVLRLFYEIKQGILKAKHCGGFDSIGIDTWGVDFGLLDADGYLLENPVHYRDHRNDGMAKEAEKYLSKKEMYDITGIQFMDFNTAFQLLSLKEKRPALLERANGLLLMPDLFVYFLTGKRIAEYSIATTTQLIDLKTGDWSKQMTGALGLPHGILPPVTQPGTIVGTLLPELQKELGVPAVPVVAVCGHDTQSAICAVPAEQKDFAFISSGTWSLFGTETESPVCGEKALAFNVTNEGGFDHAFAFLKNICGLWLLQESRRQWQREGTAYSFAELEAAAREAEAFRSFIDPDDPSFASPGDLPSAAKEYCRRTAQPIPETIGEIVRCFYESLALTYRRTLEGIQDCTGKKYHKIYVVGGGTRDRLLLQMTADSCGVPVSAGPVEATVFGNLLVQLIAAGEISSIAEGREIIRQSEPPVLLMPSHTEAWENAYHRFVALTKKEKRFE